MHYIVCKVLLVAGSCGDASSATRFIEDFEGRRLVAYQCSAGVWTLGVGHTAGVKAGDTCTDGLLCYEEPSVNSIFGVYNVSNVAVAEKPFAYVNKMTMSVYYNEL